MDQLRTEGDEIAGHMRGEKPLHGEIAGGRRALGVMNFIGVVVGGIALAYAIVELLPAIAMLVSLFVEPRGERSPSNFLPAVRAQ